MLKSEAEKNSRRLLILSCSVRKHSLRGKTTAWELYDGVAFRVVKRALREQPKIAGLDILILSAKYGLIHPEEQIANYDQLMTKAMAVRQANHNINLLKTQCERTEYREVFVCAGRTYLAALSPTSHWLSSEAIHIVPDGGIGKKLTQLRGWLAPMNKNYFS